MEIDNTTKRRGTYSATAKRDSINDRCSWPISNVRSNLEEISLRCFVRMTNTAPDDYHIFYFGLCSEDLAYSGTSQAMLFRVWVQRDTGEMILDVDYQAVNIGASPDVTEIWDSVDYADTSWVGLRIDYNFVNYTATFYTDRGESGLGDNEMGVWEKQTTLKTFNSSSRDELTHVVFQYVLTRFDTDEQLYIDDITLTTYKDIVPTLIGSVKKIDCSKVMDSGGVASIVLREF